MINEIELGKHNFSPEPKNYVPKAASSKTAKVNDFEGQLKRCSQKEADSKKNNPNVSSPETDDTRRSQQEKNEPVFKKDQNKDQSTCPEKMKMVDNSDGTVKTEEGALGVKTEDSVEEESINQILAECIALPEQVEDLAPLPQVQAETTGSSTEVVPEQTAKEIQPVKTAEMVVENCLLTGAKAPDEIVKLPVENAQVSISADKTGVKESITALLVGESAPEPKLANELSSKKDNSKTPVQKHLLVEPGNESEPKGETNDVKRIMQVESQRSNNIVPSLSDRQVPVESPEIKEAPKSDNLLGQLLMDRMPVSSVTKNDLTITDLDNTAPKSPSTQEVFDQIVKKVELFSKDKNSEMKIQLKPEFLGKMTIKLVVEDGMVTAKFFTESNQVKQILESNMNNLKQTLEASGLRVEKTEVNVQLSNGGQFGGDQQQSNLWQRYEQAGRANYRRVDMENSYLMEEMGGDILPFEESAEFNGMDELQGRFSIRI